jgi:hypothetical protein
VSIALNLWITVSTRSADSRPKKYLLWGLHLRPKGDTFESDAITVPTIAAADMAIVVSEVNLIVEC